MIQLLVYHIYHSFILSSYMACYRMFISLSLQDNVNLQFHGDFWLCLKIGYPRILMVLSSCSPYFHHISPYVPIIPPYSPIFLYVSPCFPINNGHFTGVTSCHSPTKKAPQLLRSVAQRLAQLSIPELLQDATTVLQAGKPWENHGKTMGKSVILRKTHGKPWFILG